MGQQPTLNARVAYRWLLGLSRVLERATRWVLQNVEADAASAGIVDQNLTGLHEIAPLHVHLLDQPGDGAPDRDDLEGLDDAVERRGAGLGGARLGVRLGPRLGP